MFEQKVEDLIIKNTILDYVNRLQSSFVLYNKIKTNDIKSKALDKLFMIGRVNPFIPLIMNVFEKENEKEIKEERRRKMKLQILILTGTV